MNGVICRRTIEQKIKINAMLENWNEKQENKFKWNTVINHLIHANNACIKCSNKFSHI